MLLEGVATFVMWLAARRVEKRGTTSSTKPWKITTLISYVCLKRARRLIVM